MSIEITVNCRDMRKHKDEVAVALNEFKKEIKKSGLMQELRRREEFTPPSKARRIKREESFKQRKRDAKKTKWQGNKSDL